MLSVIDLLANPLLLSDEEILEGASLTLGSSEWVILLDSREEDRCSNV